jgi:site-specific recombinase XerD
METSLAVVAEERPERGMARREVADPLAGILAGQLSEHTRRAYRHDVSHLLLFLQEGPVPEWGELTREAKHARLARAFSNPGALRLLLTVTRADLIAFRTHLKEVGLSTLATNRRLAGVGTLLRELQLQGYRPDNPAERLRTLRTSGDYSPTRGLTAEQARALLAAPAGDDLPDLRDRALLALMLRNGLRAAEVVGLRVSDLGEDQGFRVATIHGKGGKLRQAKLAGVTWEALQA